MYELDKKITFGGTKRLDLIKKTLWRVIRPVIGILHDKYGASTKIISDMLVSIAEDLVN